MRLVLALAAVCLLEAAPDLAVVRPYASREEIEAMSRAFGIWNTASPCGDKALAEFDLFLVYSRRLDANSAALIAAESIQNSFRMRSDPWHRCFRNLHIQAANLTADEDVYDSRGYAVRKDWVNGPNRVFRFILRGFLDQSFGDYHAFFFMEFDSIPLRSFWLDQFHAEVTYYPRTAIRGSRYRGDSWDNFLHAIPTQLLYHINGNAVYFVKHPWLVFLEQQLQEEASSENSSVAFDVRMAALTLEAPAFKPELAAAWAASVPPGENPYSDDSLLVGNYANTLLNESFDPGVFVRHGALSNILQNINESVITLAVQSFHELEDSLLLQSLREVNHPFREIIMLSSTASPTQQIQTVSGVSRLHYRVPARASELALCDLADAVETPFFAFTDTFHFVPGSTYVLTADGRPVLPYIPAMSQFCTDFAECVSSLDQAESFFGVRLNFHHDKYETLFETELVIEFCQTWRVAASGLGTLEDCDYQHGPTADDYIAWLISVDKSFNYVPKNKERVGWRPWTTLWSAPPPDVRNCSIYKSGDALERQQGIKECSLYLQESACRSHPNCRFRPIFGAGKCMSSSEYELLPEPVNIVTRTWSSSTSTSTTSSTSTLTSRLTTITPGNTRSSTMTSTLTHTLGTCEEGLPRGAGIDVSDCLERVAGESCQVRCTGLYSGGPAEFLCDGEFIGPEFQCQERTCSTQQLPLGFVTSGCEETRLGEICLVRCPQGFIPGESVWVCAADGQFYGFEPNCQALECGLDTLPEGIGFDASSCKGVLAGESCQVSCSYGFEGEASTFSCQENGALQGFAPICSKKTCAVPEFLQSARFSTTCASIRHGETCVSTCNFGFEGATTQLRCENGVLEGSSPTCTGLACSLQGLVIETGMDISNCSGTRSLESCMLGCFRGYTLAGDPHMTCQPSGQFLQEAFTCIPDSCGDLSQVASFAPPSVGTSCDSLVFGETCSAFCELGWELVGNTSVMVCEGSAVLGGSGFAQYLNGSFVPANETQGPSCQAQVCSQGLPSLKGVIHDCAGKTTGQSCTVSAAHGYEAEPTTLTCGPEGSFEGAMPLIRPAACPNTEFPPGIGTTCNGTQVGAECWAYCEAGWFGASRRYECGLNTTLQVGDVEVISCSNTSAGSRRLAEETCFEASIAAIGLSDPRFTHSCTALAHGELCAAHCSAGYAMLESEPQLLVCEDGQIIGGLPSCNPQPCGFGFPSGLGVSHNCSAVPTEQTCTATCEEEYEYLVGGPETFQCMPSGNLLGNTPQCMRKQCNDLQLPPFYQHNCRSKRFGDTCGVNCVAGYHLTGWGSQFRCNGTSWLGSLPDCKPDPCEDISLGGELMGSCEGLRTGESCEVSCASGFEPNSSRLTCHGSGSLQGAIPSCQPALCGGEGQLGLASLAHNCIDVAFGRHCAVYCAPGYEIQGLVQEWRCGLNGTRLELSGSLPSCVPAPCLGGPTPLPGYLDNCSLLRSGERCTQSCADGFVVTNSTETMTSFLCKDGVATGDRLRCEPIICDSNFLILHVSHSCDAVPMNGTCVAFCQPGFQLQGSSQRWTCAGPESNLPVISAASQADSVALRGFLPVCLPQTCSYNIPWASRFTHNCQSVSTGSACEVHCAQGTAGAATRLVCQSSGALQGALPACQEVTRTTTFNTVTSTATATTTVVFALSVNLTLVSNDVEALLTDADVREGLANALAKIFEMPPEQFTLALQSDEDADRALLFAFAFMTQSRESEVQALTMSEVADAINLAISNSSHAQDVAVANLAVEVREGAQLLAQSFDAVGAPEADGDGPLAATMTACGAALVCCCFYGAFRSRRREVCHGCVPKSYLGVEHADADAAAELHSVSTNEGSTSTRTSECEGVTRTMPPSREVIASGGIYTGVQPALGPSHSLRSAARSGGASGAQSEASPRGSDLAAAGVQFAEEEDEGMEPEGDELRLSLEDIGVFYDEVPLDALTCGSQRVQARAKRMHSTKRIGEASDGLMV